MRGEWVFYCPQSKPYTLCNDSPQIRNNARDFKMKFEIDCDKTAADKVCYFI